MARPRQNTFFFLLSALFVVTAASVSTAFAEGDEPRREPIEIEAIGQRVVDSGVADSLPAGSFFADEQAFAAWWEQAELAEEDRPEIDFETVFLSVEYQNAADPNRVHHSATLNSLGQVDVVGITTLMGFEPSDQTKLLFIAIPREGVVGIARWRAVGNEAGNAHMFRVIYPLVAENEEEPPADN